MPVESLVPYSTHNTRKNTLLSLGFFTEITRVFSIGARIGAVINHPDFVPGFGAIALRLPALYSEKKEFFSFFFEEIDLGITGAFGGATGADNRYASFRLGILLF